MDYAKQKMDMIQNKQIFVKKDNLCSQIQELAIYFQLMTTLLSQSQTQPNIQETNSIKQNLSKQFQTIYLNVVEKLSLQKQQNAVSSMFHNYHQQIQEILNSSLLDSQVLKEQSDSARDNSTEDSDSQQSAMKCEQPSYLFLRNVWQGTNSVPKISTFSYDPEDHIDRINKAVAMIKQQTVYMTKKQNYLYEKQQSNSSFLAENPFFMRMKQQLEKTKMENEELVQKATMQTDRIDRLQKDKILLENSLRNLKKKFQQMEKSWIEISKKNISLQQQSLMLKSQNSKSRLNLIKESTDLSTIETRQTGSYKRINNDTKQSGQAPKLSTVLSSQILRPLQNVFIDVKLKNNKPTNRYSKINSENQQASQEYLRDVTEKTISANNNQQLQLSQSDQVVVQVSNLKFKNIRNQTSARKTLLLTSARSVDLTDKTSLNKPKFERTKPNPQAALKSMIKDGCADLNIEKPSLLKNQFLFSNDQTSSLVKCFRNEPRQFTSKREQVK